MDSNQLHIFLKKKSEEQKDNKSKLTQQSSKVVSINDTAKEKSCIQKLCELLTNTNLSPLSRIEGFFEMLFQEKQLPFTDEVSFKEWQLKLSTVIIEGQQNLEFVNTISPMDLSELLLTGYKGMLDRCQSCISNNFFEIWIKANRRILLV